MRNSIYIPSIDAKDLYLSNSLINNEKNKIGYNLKLKDGRPNYNRYINSLDFSLDTEKLREVAQKVYGKSNKLTFINRGKEYSDKVINVTFKYSCKIFNKVKKNTYVKVGYLFDDLTFRDNIAVKNNEIVGIITETKTESKAKYPLPDGFSIVQDIEGKFEYNVKTLKVLNSKKDLRTYLYDNGFFCNGNHYIRFKRTSGSARVGKCLFIEESLYSLMHDWEMCGLDIKEGDQVDLAALESYISLPTSSAVDTLEIDPRSIAVIPDYDSHFKEDSIIVEMNDNKRINVREGTIDVSNSIFDGQSLIDVSIMGTYNQYGMVLLRNRFFKSCCFNTNLQQWFKDQKITEISQLHPETITLAEKIEDIKLITTPNSIKYCKFASIRKWLEEISSTFGLVKHEKKTHFFDGQLVQAHYQLLNTLQLTPTEVHELLKPSLDYVNYLNTNTDVLKYHVKCSVSDEDDEYVSNVFKSKNDIIYTMMNYSDEFYHTKYFYDFKRETCKAYLKNLKKGHILINGNYSVLFGNPYEMLLHSIGKFNGDTSLPSGYLHTTRYPYGKKVLGCRSPHISTSNILISTNLRHDLIDRYFNLTDEIVCINAIGENTLERLSGADYDSDQMIISDNEIIINAALKNYNVFKVPANRVKAKKSVRYYTNEDKADLDYRTSENKIGEIVNLSQELNTLMWDYINHSKKELAECYDDIKDIYHDICALNVLSCIEIDKAKKEFDISSTREIHDIKSKWEKRTFDNKAVKPAFLGFIAQTKGYRNPDKKKYNYHRTTMDYLLKEINKYRSEKMDAKDFTPLSHCFKSNNFNENSVNKKQIKKIIQMCESTVSSINAIWSKEYYTRQEKLLISNNYRDSLVCEIQKLKMNEHTLVKLLTFIDSKKYSHISKILFYILFNFKNETLIELMIDMKPAASYIIMSNDNKSDIELYGINFVKRGGNLFDKS